MKKATITNRTSQNENLGFFDLIATRHSIRAYKSQKLTDETINKILSAANKAPSAGNLQSYHVFAAIQSEDKKQLAIAAHDQDFIKDASIVLIFCADYSAEKKYGERGRELYCIQDATIACAYAQLACHALGLASVWVGAFEEDQVRKFLSLENGLKPVAMLVIGFADEEPEKTDRKPIYEIHQKA